MATDKMNDPAANCEKIDPPRFTLMNFIEKYENCSYIPDKINSTTNVESLIEADIIAFLNKIDVEKDVFIKNVDDKVFIKHIKEKLDQSYGENDNSFHFITWVDIPDKWSFWMFPVVMYQNNTMVDLINNAVSIVKFRLELDSGFLRRDDNKIKVTLVGDYPEEFTNGEELSSIKFIKRQTAIIRDHLEDVPNVSVDMVGHQYEQRLDNTDILILPNGLIGNAIYRAWFSTKLTTKDVNHASFVVRKEDHTPIWVGRSIHDGDNDIEARFAKACWNIKNNYLSNKKAIHDIK